MPNTKSNHLTLSMRQVSVLVAIVGTLSPGDTVVEGGAAQDEVDALVLLCRSFDSYAGTVTVRRRG